MMSPPELSRPVRIDALGVAPTTIRIAADASERRALAARFELIALDRLEAALTLTGDGTIIACDGRIEAAAMQSCIASGEPVASAIDEAFRLRFAPDAGESGEELELDANDLDTIGYAGASIDLGEAVAQTLGLALDPFPRAPDAEAALREAGVIDEEAASPFGALKALRDRL